MQKIETGFILLSVLIFLLMFTLLGLTILNSTTLQMKMSAGYINKLIATNAAQTGLVLASSKLLGENRVKPITLAVIHYQIQLSKSTRCYRFYWLSSIAHFRKSIVHLLEEVKVVKIPIATQCLGLQPSDKIIAWREIQ